MSLNTGRKKASLAQLLTIMMSLALILLLVGNLVLNVISARSYLQEELYGHAQDSATSLGLSLSTVIDADDDVLAGRMIDAIFDSGDYSKILYFGTDKRLRVEKKLLDQNAGVPDWFVLLVDLDAPLAVSQVMSGWRQLGELVVQTNTQRAYRELWLTAQTQVIWFGLVLCSALLLMRLLLARLLGPLKEVERQAHEMSRRNFDFRLKEPRTRELASVSGAMNDMAGVLGELFQQQLESIESLREQTLHDDMTGLYNREGFDRRLRAELESRQSVKQGTLLLIKIADFDGLNVSLGRDYCDAVLRELAGVLNAELVNHVEGFAARRSGADFCLFLPSLLDGAVDSEMRLLMTRLSSLNWVKQTLRDDILFVGVSTVTPLDDVSRLLSKADMALRVAQDKGVSGWSIFSDDEGRGPLDEVREANRWHQVLMGAIASEGILLYQQGVYQMGDGGLMYQKVLARLSVDEVLVDAGTFIPMARRFNLMVDLDKLVIGQVLALMRNSSAAFSVSVSESSIADQGFVSWLAVSLSSLREKSASLYVSIPEYALRHNEAGVAKLCDLLDKCGAKVVVERFGISSVPFSYLQRLKIAAIKVDHSFVRGIHENIENQFFLRSVIQLAGGQGVAVIAVGVECEQEMEVLTRLGVSGTMGYLLGRPEPII